MLDLLLALGLGGLAALAGLTSDEYPDPGPATAALMGAAGWCSSSAEAGRGGPMGPAWD
jgi:hypothetical protein